METGAPNPQATDIKDWLREGIAAARSGQRERARDLLVRVVEQDEENATAWLWLSGVVDSLDDREVCLENALTLDPGNEAARKGLAWVQQQKGGQSPPPAETIPPPSAEAPASKRPASLAAAVLGEDLVHRRLPPALEPPPEKPARARKPTTLAAAVLREDFAARRPPPEPELPPPVPPPDEFEDEYLCPYCAAPTRPDDRKCQACGHQLWIKVRRREEHSSWLWVALVMQLAGTVWPATVPLMVLVYVAHRVGATNPFDLIPAYLGLPGNVPPEVADAALKLAPRAYILPFILHFLFSSAVLVGLYQRWKPVFYLFLVSALLMLTSAIAALVIIPSNARICGGGGVILALLMLLLLLQLEDDFFFDERRLVLRVDRDATNGPALLASGQCYAKRAMWAMAAIHLRRAASKMPHEVACPLLLTTAYIGLKRYDLAEKTLSEARRLSPDDPQIEKLAAVLAGQRKNLPESSELSGR